MATPFSHEDLDRAHRGVGQATVRDYLRKLSDLGVVSYTTHVSDGHSDYADAYGNSISSAAVHEHYEVSDAADRDAARRAIDLHRQRATDYFAFSRQLAAAGVAAWVVDPIAMTCTFCSSTGEPLIVDDA